MQRVVAILPTLAAACFILLAAPKLYAASSLEMCDREAGLLSASSSRKIGVSWKELDPKKAIPACKRALQEKPDEIRIWFQLARAFLKAKNYDAAFSWFRKAAEQGDARAQYSLGQRYDKGKGVLKSHAKGFEWQLKAAKQGLEKALNIVGWRYHQGIGTPRNYTEAKRWYLKAAEVNDPYAQDNLGIMYENGLGRPVDNLEAANWYRLAAEQGNEWGNFHLGDLYRRGIGVERDYNRALELYMKAGDKGHIEAYQKIAEIFEYGLGVEKDLVKAARWLKKAQTAPKEYEDETVATLGVMRHRSQAKIQLKYIQRIIKERRETKRRESFSEYRDINFGNYYALVIGNNNYKHLEKLKTAVSDASAVADLLKNKYGFDVTLVTNATRKQISTELNRFRKSLYKNDNLLIYYAGHGVYDEDTKTGYWQPIDAETEDDTEWIANDRVSRVLKGLQSLNVLVVADSCYSGTVSRGVGSGKLTAETKGQMFKRLVKRKTRIALTSGGLEPVVDSFGGSKHSVFADTFLKILTENNEILTTNKLYEALREQVIPIMVSNGVDQTPEYASLYKSGHNGGDFLFVPKNMVSRFLKAPNVKSGKPSSFTR